MSKNIKKTVERRTTNLITFTDQLKTEINYWFDSDFVGLSDPDEISPMDSDIVDVSDSDESSLFHRSPNRRRRRIVDSEESGTESDDSNDLNEEFNQIVAENESGSKG